MGYYNKLLKSMLWSHSRNIEVYVMPKTIQMTIPLYGEGTTKKVLSSYIQNNTLHLELERIVEDATHHTPKIGQHDLEYDENRFKDGVIR
jgi:hypothetical protein